MQQVVERTARGICIDVETWEKERYHWVSVYEGYLKKTCIYLKQTLLVIQELNFPSGNILSFSIAKSS